MSKSKGSRLSGQELKEANSKISKLRKLGLYSGKAARGQPTNYALGLLKKYDEVLSGKAAVVSIPSKDRKEFKAKFADRLTIKGSKVIVPKNPLNEERAHYSKREKTVVVTGIGGNGKKYRAVYDVKAKPPVVRPGAKVIRFYKVPIRGPKGRVFFTPEFDNFLGLQKYMQAYETGSGNYHNWRNYVVITEIEL